MAHCLQAGPCAPVRLTNPSRIEVRMPTHHIPLVLNLSTAFYLKNDASYMLHRDHPLSVGQIEKLPKSVRQNLCSSLSSTDD